MLDMDKLTEWRRCLPQAVTDPMVPRRYGSDLQIITSKLIKENSDYRRKTAFRWIPENLANVKSTLVR